MVVSDLSLEDRAFLNEVNNRLNEIKHMPPTGRFGDYNGYDYWASVRDQKFADRELERTLSLLEPNDLMFIPMNTESGFCVGYRVSELEVVAPGVPGEEKMLLRFIENQLPEGWNFQKLSEYFMRPRNLELVGILNQGKERPIEVVNDYVKYDY